MPTLKEVREFREHVENEIKELSDILQKAYAVEEDMMKRKRDIANNFYHKHKEKLMKKRDYDRLRHYNREYYHNVRKNLSKLEKLPTGDKVEFLVQITPFDNVSLRRVSIDDTVKHIVEI